MSLPTLTGAQKTKLRGLGQKLDSMMSIGQAGITPAVLVEINRLLASNELVKLRFVGSDRHVRATLAAEIAEKAPAVHAGSVGATALFYRENPDEAKRSISF
jgi:RNA-binding protein